MKVELGSVVYLKSGGPLMTVEELGEHADVDGHEIGSE